MRKSLVAWTVCWATVSSAAPLTILDSRRHGTNIEDAAFVDHGTYKGQLVILDGDELRVVQLDHRDVPQNSSMVGVIAVNDFDALDTSRVYRFGY
jgi:hypothetical protein